MGPPPVPGPGLPAAEAPARQPPASVLGPTGEQEPEQPESQGQASAGVPGERPAPVLTPPVLLTAPGVESFESAQVALDRSLLTPQLRVTAREGIVVLAVLVRVDGSVGQVKIEASSGVHVIDTAAVRAAATWQFRPATRDGSAIESWAIIPVRFILH